MTSNRPVHPTANALPSPQPGRRVRRWLVVVVSGVIVVWMGRFAYLKIMLEPTPNDAYWSDQFANLDPPPAGAMAYCDAMDVIGPNALQSDAALDAPNWDVIHSVCRGAWDAQRADIVAVDRFFSSPAFEARYEAIARVIETGWYPRPTRPRFRIYQAHEESRCAGMLRAHMRWAAETGRPALARRDFLLIVKIGREFVRSRDGQRLYLCFSTTRNAVFEAILLTQEGMTLGPAADMYDRANQILAEIQDASALLAGQRLVILEMIDHTYVSHGAGWLDVSKAASLRRFTFPAWRPIVPSRLWNLTSPVFLDREQAIQFANACFDEICALGWQGGMPLAAAAKKTIEKRRREFALFGLPSGEFYWTEYGLQSYAAARTYISGAIVTIGLAEFKARHGVYPDSLSELTPAILPEVPIDSMNGAPLRYERVGDRYLLYTDGVNGIDGEEVQDQGFPWQWEVFSEVKRYPSDT